MLKTEQLDELAAKAAANGCLVVDATVEGELARAEVDDFDALGRLIGAARVVYLTKHTWGPQLRQFTFERLCAEDADRLAVDIALREEQVCLVVLSILVDGVLHVATAANPEFDRLHTLVEEAVERRNEWDERQQQRQDDEYAAAQTRVDDVVSWISDELANALLADATWLALSSSRAREAHAKHWVIQRFPDCRLEQKLVTVILDEVALAVDRRDDIVAARTAVFRERMVEHGRRLAGKPAFAAANSRSCGALVDEYVRSVDAMVPAVLVRDELLAEARLVVG